MIPVHEEQRGASLIAAAIDQLAEAIQDSAGRGAGLLEIARALVGIERAIRVHAEALLEVADRLKERNDGGEIDGG